MSGFFNTYIIGVVLLACWIEPAYTINYRMINYTVNEGLPSSEVYHVIQDSKGFIWFATNQGVSRFDGYRFENFDLTDGLPDNTVFEVYEDNRGRIWFIPHSGMLSYYKNGRIVEYKYNNVIRAYLKHKMYPIKLSFYVDKWDNVYLSVYGERILKISADGIIDRIIPQVGGGQSRLIQLMPDGQLLYDRYNKSDSQVVVASDSGDFFFTHDMKYGISVRVVAAAQDSLIYYADGKDLMIINHLNKRHTIRHYNNDIIWISIDEKGSVWLGFLRGGVKCASDPLLENAQYDLLPDCSVSSVMIDYEGGTWLTTLNNGVYYLPDIRLKALTSSDDILANSITQLDHHNNKIWFGGDCGTLYTYDFKNLESINYFQRQDVYNKCIQWIGDSLCVSLSPCYPGGYIMFDEEVIREIDSYFYGVFERMDGSRLLYGKFLSSLKQDHVENYDLKQFFIEYCFDLEESEDGELWIGSEKGLFLLQEDQSVLSMGQNCPLLNHRIQCLENHQGDLWIGTKGAGLLCMNSDTIRQYTMKEGLPSNSINSVLFDNDTIWIGTNRGIAKMNRKLPGVGIEKWSVENGLYNNEVNKLVLFNKHIFAATNGGLCFFDARISGVNNYAPPVYVDSIVIMSKDTVIYDTAVLSCNQNDVKICYTGVSYKRTNPLMYQYKLKGLEADWKQTDQTSVQYLSLPPGNYVFKVRAINNSGIVSSSPQSFSFIIRKPYWQTAWFKLVSALLVFAVIIGFIYFFQRRLKNIKRNSYLENEMDRYRQKALSAQINPHFIYNSLNSVQNYILKNDALKASDYLSRLGDLMRRILDNSQHELISLKEEIRALSLYIDIELTRFGNSFSYNIEVDRKIALDEVMVPPLILQPFVENAIHHGLRERKEGEKRLILRVLLDDGLIKILIEDNGIGRRKRAEIQQKRNTKKAYKPLGTKLTTRRLMLFEEIYKKLVYVSIDDLLDDKNNPVGTRVTLLFNQSLQ